MIVNNKSLTDKRCVLVDFASTTTGNVRNNIQTGQTIYFVFVIINFYYSATFLFLFYYAVKGANRSTNNVM